MLPTCTSPFIVDIDFGPQLLKNRSPTVIGFRVTLRKDHPPIFGHWEYVVNMNYGWHSSNEYL
jgi:hypothetical protein